MILIYVIINLLAAYFISEPTDKITVFEGHSVRLDYTLLIDRFPIEFKKNNCSIRKAKDHPGRLKTLRIEPISLDDTGEYCIDVAGITSKTTHVVVKRTL